MRKVVIKSIVSALSGGLTIMMFEPFNPHKSLILSGLLIKVFLALSIIACIAGLISLTFCVLHKFKNSNIKILNLISTLSCTIGVILFLFLGYFYILLILGQSPIPTPGSEPW